MAIDSLERFFNPTPRREGHYSSWRCEAFGAGPESGASVRDVVAHEREVNGKDIEVDEDLLREMDRVGLWAIDVIWVCESAQEAVMRYGEVSFKDDFEMSEETLTSFKGDLSEAREVALGPEALVLGIDDDGGYLVLLDASKLDSKKVEAFKAHRRVDSQSLAL